MSPRRISSNNADGSSAVQVPQPRVGHRLVRGVTLLGMAFHRQLHEVVEAQQPGNRDDVSRVSAELASEPVPQVGGHVGADLHAYRPPRTSGRSAPP